MDGFGTWANFSYMEQESCEQLVPEYQTDMLFGLDWLLVG